MSNIPIISGKQAVNAFIKAGWYLWAGGSHMVLTKSEFSNINKMS